MSHVFVDNVGPDSIHVGDGVRIPSRWDAIVTGESDTVGTIRVECVYDEHLRRSVASSVRVDRLGESDEVTAASLRDVSVLQVVQRSAVAVVTVQRGEEEPKALEAYLSDVRAYASALTFDDTVREAVRLYRIGTTVNLPPLKLVSDHLGVSVSTATRMMSRARGAGLAEDLISRETYHRMRADEEAQSRGYPPPGSASGPSLGR